MNKTIATLAIFGTAGALFAQEAATQQVAQPSDSIAANLSIAGTFGYENAYVFRGALKDRNSFQSGVELGYAVGGGEVYAGVWGSLPISNYNGVKEFDYYLGYNHAIDIVTLDTGFTYYSYAGQAIQHTREIYVGASVDVLLSPSLYFYYDFDLNQTVFEGSISYSLDLSQYTNVEGLSLENKAYVGFLNARKVLAQPGTQKNGYTYFGFASDIAYAISENVSTSFGIRWAMNTDGHNSNASNNSVNGFGTKDNQFWFGASVGLAY